MSPDYHLTPITGLDARLRPLQDEAASDGVRFVARLANDWVSGSNTFSRPGEHLVGVVREAGLVGFCGLNRDPYTTQSDVGRLRHLYVSRRERQKGIGAALVRHLLAKARGTFRIVRLRTDTAEAALFYERLGFKKIQEQDASHVFTL